MPKILRLHLICLYRLTTITAAIFCQTVQAAEYIRNESPQPATAKDLTVSIDHAFTERPLSERFLLSNVKDYLADQPGFWSEAKVNFELRSYLFRRRNSSIYKPEAYVIGGRSSFESGWWHNFGVGLAYYNSTELNADDPGTGLLGPDQHDINVWGEANLRYRFTGTPLEGSVLKLGRQTLNLPFINKHDIRQVPASHEAYTLSRVDTGNLRYIVGHITEFKDYDNDKFVDMADAAGATGEDEGVSIVGARRKFTNGTTIGAATYYGWDTFNTFFTEGTYHADLSEKIDMRLSVQFTDQRSVGDELIGDFDSHQVAGKASFGWRGAMITFGGSVVDDNAGIMKPWGGSPSYLSIQRLDFDRAGEKSALLGFSYNTAYFSSLGLSSYVNIAHGWDAEDPLTGVSLPDRTEYDLTVDYKPPQGFLEGLWIRARFNYIDTDGDSDEVHDFRLIINYTLPFI